MKATHVLGLLLFITPLTQAGEIKVGTRWPELTTSSGQRFWDVKFTFVSPREVRFMHTGGVGSMPLSQLVLPEDVTVTVSAPAAPQGSLEAMMTAEERKASGIDKLSDAEQAALARWMQQTASNVLKEALEKQWARPSSFDLSATAPVPTPPQPAAQGPALAGPPMMATNLAGPGPQAAAVLASPQSASPVPVMAGGVLPTSQRDGFPAPSPALLPPPRPVMAPTTASNGAED